jgi:hypothetical protein
VYATGDADSFLPGGSSEYVQLLFKLLVGFHMET